MGYINRAGFSFTMNKSIGFGYMKEDFAIKKDYLQAGEYELEVKGKKYKAQYHDKPFFDPKNERVIKGNYENSPIYK